MNDEKDNVDDMLKQLDNNDTQDMRVIWEGFTLDKTNGEDKE